MEFLSAPRSELDSSLQLNLWTDPVRARTRRRQHNRAVRRLWAALLAHQSLSLCTCPLENRAALLRRSLWRVAQRRRAATRSMLDNLEGSLEDASAILGSMQKDVGAIPDELQAVVISQARALRRAARHCRIQLAVESDNARRAKLDCKK